jgi:predicted RNase H-like nuclease
MAGNETGQRPCETLIARNFGKYHASCHTMNLGRPHARAGMNLVARCTATAGGACMSGARLKP